MTYSLGKTSLANLALVDPAMGGVVKLAITLTTQDFGVYSGARTAAEQNALYQIGRTKPGKRVTDKDGYKSKSNHQTKTDGYGDSVDLVPWVDGKGAKGAAGWFWDDTWAIHYAIAVAMSQAARQLKVKIKWGGNWYETMDQYPATIEGVKAAVERYKKAHEGADFLDAPHFELAA